MPAQRVSMRKTREILRLRLGEKLTQNATAQSVGCSGSTVAATLARFANAGLSWPLPEGLDDEALEARLYPKPEGAKAERPAPDYQKVHLELRRKGMTLMLLWQEYRQVHANGFGYTIFCEGYRAWRSQVEPVMRQVHVPGERMFVDYAGVTVPITDGATGEVSQAQVFVAAMGASSYTFAQACKSQDSRSWQRSHIDALEFFGGVPRVWVPDNLKAGVTNPCYYDPEINVGYKALADHYDATVIPTRVRKPKDKAKVENAVQQVERWVLAPLRNQTFFSIEEANAAIVEKLKELNERALSQIEGTRRRLFDQIDLPALKPLPQHRYECAQWHKGRVNIDYHVEFDGHYYSVPYPLIGKKVIVRGTSTTVEILWNDQRVASHLRSYQKGRFTTCDEHRPPNHRSYGQWPPQRMLSWASTIGPNAEAAVARIMKDRKHPEHAYRSVLGLMRLAERFGVPRTELACARAMALQSPGYRTIKSILDAGLEKDDAPRSRNTDVPNDRAQQHSRAGLLQLNQGWNETNAERTNHRAP